LIRTSLSSSIDSIAVEVYRTLKTAPSCECRHEKLKSSYYQALNPMLAPRAAVERRIHITKSSALEQGQLSFSQTVSYRQNRALPGGNITFLNHSIHAPSPAALNSIRSQITLLRLIYHAFHIRERVEFARAFRCPSERSLISCSWKLGPRGRVKLASLAPNCLHRWFP
jgi:hypothetical protein